MRSSTSILRLDVADLERLLARFASPYVARPRVVREGDRLLLQVDALRLPTPLLPAFPASFELKAGLVEGMRNVVAVRLQAEKLPLGLQALANPFLDKLAEQLLPPAAATFVEIHPPSVFWIHLERIPEHGRPFAELLTLTALAVPGRDGSALEASFGVTSGSPAPPRPG
jgi:hypothetical protein